MWLPLYNCLDFLYLWPHFIICHPLAWKLNILLSKVDFRSLTVIFGAIHWWIYFCTFPTPHKCDLGESHLSYPSHEFLGVVPIKPQSIFVCFSFGPLIPSLIWLLLRLLTLATKPLSSIWCATTIWFALVPQKHLLTFSERHNYDLHWRHKANF